MSRGSLYGWPYFLLFDEDDFYEDATDPDTGLPGGPPNWDEQRFALFKIEVLQAFHAEGVDERPVRARNLGDHDAYVFGMTDRMLIGIDHSGDVPCVFAQPRTYERRGRGGAWVEKEYQVGRDVGQALARLIRLRPGFYRYPTTAWTSARVVGWNWGPILGSQPQRKAA